ncbi:MAG: hypothetical protein JWR60_3569 [Polaromonas sp.]|nr:hypothetical protein [Polaromonas sp.]
MKRIAILAVFVASHALAHHGWSEYDAGQPLELAGTIEASGYSHPHGFAQLKAGSKTWTVVLAPPSRMENRGLTQQMLAAGKQASVYGYPNRNKPEELRAERITVEGKTVELR